MSELSISNTSGWSASERESFLAAIERHRRASWRVTAASIVADLVVMLLVAALLAPVLYGIVILALDLVNFVHRTPDLMRPMMRALGSILRAPLKVPPQRLLSVSLMIVLPGLLLMLVVLAALRRALRAATLYDARTLSARPPDTRVLEEQRFANTVAEMAIAAGLPQPRVLVTDRPLVNAAVFGWDARNATVVISEALLATLDRAELQGVAADLIAAVANGDVPIGHRVTCTLALFGVISRLRGVLGESAALVPVKALLLYALRPQASGAQSVVFALTDPFGSEDSAEPATALSGWRRSVRLPLAGPLAMCGMFCSIMAAFALGPLIALAWRQRKYMADATAVRLTRDPDTLARALEKMARSRSIAALAPSAAHLSIVAASGSRSGIGAGFMVPMFPSIERRLKALALLGAHLSSAPRRASPIQWLILGPLGALFALLMGMAAYLMFLVSLMLSALYTWVPVAILHALLRWLAH